MSYGSIWSEKELVPDRAIMLFMGENLQYHNYLTVSVIMLIIELSSPVRNKVFSSRLHP